MTRTTFLTLLGGLTLAAGPSLAWETGLSPNVNAGHGPTQIQSAGSTRGVALVTGRTVQGVYVHTGRVTPGAPTAPGSGQPLPTSQPLW